MKTYSRFEHAASGRMTTIAPNPADGKSLVEHGWRFVTRNLLMEEVASRNPDEVRREIWRNNGHFTPTAESEVA